MKRTVFALFGWLLLAAPAAVHAQFTYTTNNGTITVTGHTGLYGLGVAIPATISGMPVTSIVGDSEAQASGFQFFGTSSSPTSSTGQEVTITIPDTVTNIGD